MARGPKKHLKRLAAPKHWMLAKQGGIFAPRPSSGPHKLRECQPLVQIQRNRLKYALTRREVLMILMNRHVKVDGKVRTDMNFPTGQMDVVSINKVGRLFRLLYSTKGHFVLHKIPQSEGNIKLCKVMKCSRGSKGSQGRNPLKIKEGGIKSLVPYLTTNDGRTIRYPDPLIQVNDTIVYNFETGKILDFAKFEIGNLVMVTKGSNIGRIGTLINIENHPGSFNIAHVKDSVGHTFATRTSNIFVIGKDQKPQISQPKEGGIAMTAIENREKILMNREKLRDTDDAVEI